MGGAFMLYPQMNEKRLVLSLNGIWDFKLGDEALDYEMLTNKFIDCEKMYVPASYNDQKADIKYRDHYGYAYYQTEFSAPIDDSKRLVLRFGAVTHKCVVYLNCVEIAQHTGGFLPFEVEIPAELLKSTNLLSVAVDNRISRSTLPMGNNDKRAMFADGIPNFESVKNTNIKIKTILILTFSIMLELIDQLSYTQPLKAILTTSMLMQKQMAMLLLMLN